MADVWQDWAALTAFLEESWMFISPDQDEPSDLLMASVLIHSYALAESSAAKKLGVEGSRLGPIERWGAMLLDAQGKTWSQVSGKEFGAVEVAVVRNSFAHGQRSLSDESVRRLERVRPDERAIAVEVDLSYGTLRRYRGRLQSLMNHGKVA